MKYIIALCAVLVMTGCVEKEKDTTPKTPDSMKDCNFVWMKRSADYFGVVTCPININERNEVKK